MSIGAAFHFYGIELGVVDEKEIDFGTIVGFGPKRAVLPHPVLR